MKEFQGNVGKYATWQYARICGDCCQKLEKCKEKSNCGCEGRGARLQSGDTKFYCEICFLKMGR